MLHVYTDGSCHGNPGPGGWAALVMLDGGVPRALSGHERSTTNQRMEQTAAIEALKATPAGSAVTLVTDSQYVIKTMTLGWKRNANRDLWVRLDELVATRQVRWEWVKAHAGHPENEFVNDLAGWESGVVPARPSLERFLPPTLSETVPDDEAAVQRPVEDQSPREVRRVGSGARPGLTHLDKQGQARMVDVGWKEETEREAVAVGRVVMARETLAQIVGAHVAKGDVLATARLAGIMGAKQTSQLIPLCHPLPLTHVVVECEVDTAGSAVQITATAKTRARTGVEMEALTAVTVAALTIYDMAKASDRAMRIEGVRLVHKSGGQSGDISL